MASFKKMSAGWQYRVSFKENGKYRTKSENGFATKKEAQVAAAELERKLERGLDIKAGDRLFSEYYKEWVKTYKKGRFSRETDKIYQTAINLVEVNFQNLTLKQLTKAKYQAFINRYAKTHSKETVRKINTKIAGCLQEAFRNGDLPIDVTYKIAISGLEGKKEEDKYLNESEAKKLLLALQDDIKLSYISRYMCILQLSTGARIGEIMAATFDSLDFRTNTLNINKAWDYKETLSFKPTKNKETRKISVDAHTMDMLRPFYNDAKKRSLSSSYDNHHKLVFVDNMMNVVSVEAVNKTLKRACIRAGVPVITSHGLRHTHASILLLHGLDLQYVSQRLGHKSQLTTASIYAHVLKEAKEKGDDQAIAIAGTLYESAK